MSISYLICPHCHLESAKGVKVCGGCDAMVRPGTPVVVLLPALVLSGWLAIKAHWLFYDSVSLAILLGAIVFGALWVLLGKVFEHRVVFKRRRRTG